MVKKQSLHTPSSAELSTVEPAMEIPQTSQASSSADTQAIVDRCERALVSMPQGMWDWDITRNDCFLSESWWQALGYRPGDYTNNLEQAAALIHPDDREQLEQYNRHIATSNSPAYDIDFRLRARDGSYRWMRSRAHIQRNHEGLAVRIVGSNSDVTEQKRVRENLLASKEFNDKLIASSVDGIMAFDRLCRLTAFNPAMERMWGRQKEDVLGCEVFESFPFLRTTHEDCFFFDTLAGKSQTSRGRTYSNQTSGRQGSFEASYVPLTESDGTISGGLVVVREVSLATSRKRQHRLLLDAGAKFSQVSNIEPTLQEVVALATEGLGDWCVVLCGRAADLPKDPEARGALIAGRHQDPARRAMLDAWLKEEPSQLDFFDGRAWDQEGAKVKSEHVENIPAGLRSLLMRDSRMHEKIAGLGFNSYVRAPLVVRNKLFGTLTIVSAQSSIDKFGVTIAELFAQRAAVAIDTAQLYTQASEAVRVREHVLTRVSHDLKSPLQAITLKCDRIERRHARGGADDTATHTLELARHFRSYADRMNTLIFGILDVAKLSLGRFPLASGPLDLGLLAQETTAGLQLVADDKSITLHCDMQKDLPIIEGDHDRLVQVLTNLLDNAIKFSPRGGSIVLRGRHSTQGTTLDVIDQGPGIPEDMQAHLFDRLWQSPSTTAQGSGLGLYIAQGIMHAHKGRIDVSSQTTQTTGTTFTLVFPQSDVASDALLQGTSDG